MRVRCFLFKYSLGGEVIRWLRDDGRDYAPQVMTLRLRDGRLEYTEREHYNGFYLSGMPELIAAGHVEEL